MEDHDKIETVNKKMEEIMNKYEKLYQDIQDEGFIEGFRFPDLVAPGVRINMPDPIPNINFPSFTILQGFEIPFPSLDDITRPIKDLFKPVTDFFDNIKNLFVNIGTGFTNFKKGMEDIFKGISVDEPIAIGNGIGIGFTNISQLLLWVGEFFLSHMVCGMYFISNLNFCFFYYLMDVVGQILYMPVRFGIWIMFVITQKDINPNIDQVWSYIYMADKWIFNNCGFHIAHWSVYVRNRCYNCRRVKSSALQRKVAEINYNFNTQLPNLVNDASIGIYNGGDKVKHAFDGVSFKL